MDPTLSLKVWNAFDGCARFLLYPDGKVLEMCDLAKEMLGAQAGIYLRAGFLCLREIPLCETALARTVGQERVGLLHRQHDGLVLGSYKICPCAEGRIVALTLRLVTGEEKPEFACLGEAFNLTPAEEAVALQLLRGSSPAEIARTDCVSINTVRCHISHIYSKLEASNREEMWVKCAPFSINNCSSILHHSKF